ncbi:hypothetical protein KMZ32_07145 [Phycicoccus sp. MAQZ13P-2]|uniref:hypothetical protein n=1 Tax=Phycicoccus mangrovi TaxID=2840470 RepID=UPI001BFFF023|nr:hypothetical protein [Phycicoccus mangrovi]MBT9256141.1 hypothetical protein [Phycicoccus mangrovi]MBT9273844.1 hypothetical protein [Phycicoccus mangrovi]
MSGHDTPPPPRFAPPPSGPTGPPLVRLQTWVNIALLIILLASCSAASNAGDVVTRVVDGGDAASSAQIDDMCRLLGAVAQKQGIDLDTVFPADSGDPSATCRTVARQAGTP